MRTDNFLDLNNKSVKERVTKVHFLPDFGGFVAEDKQHGVDDIGLPAPVGPHDAREALVEGPEDLLASVRLEPFVLDVSDDQSGPGVVHGQGRRRWRRDVDVSYPDAPLGQVVFLRVHQLLPVVGGHNFLYLNGSETKIYKEIYKDGRLALFMMTVMFENLHHIATHFSINFFGSLAPCLRRSSTISS